MTTTRRILEAFDGWLAARHLDLDAVVIGGTALNLLGIVSRPTLDCDILHPALPPEIVEAAREFAASIRASGDALDAGWLNNGPASLTRQLPRGWEMSLVDVFAGDAMRLRSLGRLDLLRTKLFALCDRGIDLGDCLALAPTSNELLELRSWVDAQDANPDWPGHVGDVLADLGRRLGHGA